MDWVKIEDALPRDGQAVLVRMNRDNHLMQHSLANGETHRVWRWRAVRFVQGKTAEQVAMGGPITGFDESGNNMRPYGWDAFGGGGLFGQDVSHWCAISDPGDNQEQPNVLKS